MFFQSGLNCVLNGFKVVFGCGPVKAKRHSKTVRFQIENLEDRALMSAATIDIPTAREVRLEQREAKREQRFAHASSSVATDAVFAEMAAAPPAPAAPAVARAAQPVTPTQNRIRTNVTAGQPGNVQPNEVRTVAVITTTISKGKFTLGGVRVIGQNLVGNVATATLSIKRNGSWVPLQSVAVVSNSIEFTDHGLTGNKKTPIELKVEFQFAPAFNSAQVSARVDLVQGRMFPLRKFPPFAFFTGSNMPDTVWNTNGGTNPTNPTLNITGTTLNQGQTGNITVGLSSAASTTTNVTLTAGAGLVFTANNSNTLSVQFMPGQTSLQVPVMALVTGSTSTVQIPVTATSSYGMASTSVTVNGAVVNNPTLNITGTTLNQGQTGNITVGLSSAATSTQNVTLTAGAGLVFTATNSNTMNVQFVAGQSSMQVSVMALVTGNTNTVQIPVTATSATLGNASANVTVNGATGGGDAEVNWDAVQFYTMRAIKIISISGFDPVYAFETMTLRIDMDRNGDANENPAEVKGWTTGDTNGGFIVQANDGGVDMPADSHGLVTFYDPASQGFRNASGITIVYVDATGVHNVNATSPNVSLNGNTLVIS